VRRGHDDAVGESRAAAPVVGEHGVRDGGGGRVPVGVVDEHRHAVGGEHLQGGDPRRLGEGVGVRAEEERSVRALRGAVLADGLAGRGDVVLVERGGQ
jgi:hypothetical protein